MIINPSKPFASMAATHPAWAETAMILATGGAGIAISILGPRYFVDSATGDVDYIAAAIPFFLLLIFVELAVLAASKLPSVGGQYVFADSWSSLASGTAQRMGIVLFTKTALRTLLPAVSYTWIWTNHALLRLSYDSLWTWLLTILLVDVTYYWTHRAGHQIAVLWAGHSVHHSSEHLNFTTALRQSFWQHAYEALAFVPAAFFFPPKVYAMMAAWNTIYQFWVHTCLIRRLGVLELIFMTPSHHRVHHDRRVHKNYGGVFIIWDKMFGTFLDEQQATNVNATSDLEVCAFGTMHVLTTWSDAVVQLSLWKGLAVKFFSNLFQGKLSSAVATLVVGPGFHTTTAPRTLSGVSAATRTRKPDLSPLALRGYVAVHLVALIAVAFAALAFAPPSAALLVLCPAVVASLALHGLLLDQRSLALPLEVLRVLVVAATLKFGGDLPLLRAVPSDVLDAGVALFVGSAVVCLLWPGKLVTTWKTPRDKTP